MDEDIVWPVTTEDVMEWWSEPCNQPAKQKRLLSRHEHGKFRCRFWEAKTISSRRVLRSHSHNKSVVTFKPLFSLSMFSPKSDSQSGNSCACGSGTWPSPPQSRSGSVSGNLDIRTESSEFSLSRSLNALLPQDVKLESIQDFRSSTESAISSIRIFARDFLPPYPVTAKAIDKFYLSTGQLFYILEEREARELLETVYTKPQDTTLPMFCELFATAAVGSQYDDLVPHAVKQSFLQTARFYLDDCLEADNFQTMRVLLLLAIFCVLDKRTACWKYIGMFCRSLRSLSRMT